MRLSESYLNRLEEQWTRRKFENWSSFPPRGTPHETPVSISYLVRHSFLTVFCLTLLMFAFETFLFALGGAYFEQIASHRIRLKVVYAFVKLLWIHKTGATWFTPLLSLVIIWSFATLINFLPFWAWNRRAARLRTASTTVPVVSPDVWPPPPNIAYPS